MSQHDDAVRLRHMLDHAREAAALIRGESAGDLAADRVLSLALIRLLEIIGEAASRVSEAARDRYPAIAWPQIVSMRNRLIHGYDSVDMEILWQILKNDIPSLIVELEKLSAPEAKR
jgi:uncharacterized protein with HEPN domain